MPQILQSTMTSAPAPSVLVIGSANMDLVVHTTAFPTPGQTVIGSSFATFEGGKGANQAVAAARYGSPTALIAALGADDHGSRLLASLAADHIDVSATVRRADAPTGVAVITINDSKNAENTIVVAPGANATLLPEDMLERAALIASARILLMQLEVPLETVKTAARIAHTAGVTVILNAAPAPSGPDNVARLCVMAGDIDLLVVNETECQVLTGSPVMAADSVPDTLPYANAVLTLGSRGCIARWRSTTAIAQPAFPVNPVVDTTAAGDAFCGVLAASLAAGCPFPVALREATAAGALACTKPGAQPSLPFKADIRVLANAPRTDA